MRSRVKTPDATIGGMVSGIHALIYTKDPDGVRAFFRDVLGFPYVDAHDGWLIFALPPAELGIHPADDEGRHELWLMCDDLQATVEELKGKGVEFTRPVTDQGFGLVTWLRTPGGGELPLYEPKHLSPLIDAQGAGQPLRGQRPSEESGGTPTS